MDAASSATSPTPCSATSPTPSQRERFRAALRRHCLESRLLTSSPSSSSSSSAPQLRVADAIVVAHHPSKGEEPRKSSVASPSSLFGAAPAVAPNSFPGAGASGTGTSGTGTSGTGTSGTGTSGTGTSGTGTSGTGTSGTGTSSTGTSSTTSARPAKKIPFRNLGGPLSVSDCCSLLQVPMPVTGGRMPVTGGRMPVTGGMMPVTGGMISETGGIVPATGGIMPPSRRTSCLATPVLQGRLHPSSLLEPSPQASRHGAGVAPSPESFVAAAGTSPQYNDQWRQQMQQQKLQEGSAVVLPESVELKQAAAATLCGKPDAAQAGWMTWAAGEQSEPEEPSSGDTAAPFLPLVWRQPAVEAPEQPAANHHLPATGAPAAAPLTPLWRHEGANGSGSRLSVQGAQGGPAGGVWLPCLEALHWRPLDTSMPSLRQADRQGRDAVWLPQLSYAGSGARIRSATGANPFCGTPDQLAGPRVGVSNLVGSPGTFEAAMGVRRGALGDFLNATASHPDTLNTSQWHGTWAEAHPGACELAMPEPGWMQQNSHHRPVPEALFISGSGPAAAAWLQRQGPGDLSASVCQGVSPGGTRTPVTRGDHFRVTPCSDIGHGLSHTMGLEGGPRSDALTNAVPLRWPLGRVDMGRQGERLRQAANEGVMGLTGCSAPCRADSAMLGQADSATGPGGSVLQAGNGGDVDEAGGCDHGSATYLSSRKEERGGGTGEEPQGDKKNRRLMSNRASAKRSRERKQDRLQELEVASAKLRVEQMELQRQLEGANGTLETYKRKNEELRDELHELKSQARGKCLKLTS